MTGEMTPHTQLYRNEPDKGIVGDCYRTVIACLLDLPPSDVPHFYSDADRPDEECLRDIQEWLRREHGLAVATVNFNDQLPLDRLLEFVGKWNPGVHVMLSGISPRGNSHIVICRDGAIVHDPHPDGGGITSPYQEGYYVIQFFIPAMLLAVESEAA